MRETGYLIVVRAENEPDNNTPATEIWAKIVYGKEPEIKVAVSIIENDFLNDYPNGVEVVEIPLSEIQDEWEQVLTIW